MRREIAIVAGIYVATILLGPLLIPGMGEHFCERAMILLLACVSASILMFRSNPTARWIAFFVLIGTLIFSEYRGFVREDLFRARMADEFRKVTRDQRQTDLRPPPSEDGKQGSNQAIEGTAR